MADSISAELSERVLRLLGEAYDFVVIDPRQVARFFAERPRPGSMPTSWAR